MLEEGLVADKVRTLSVRGFSLLLILLAPNSPSVAASVTILIIFPTNVGAELLSSLWDESMQGQTLGSDGLI